MRWDRWPVPARSACSIPPSIPMVVYAVTANVSVLQVFLGGFLPGLLVMVAVLGYVMIWSLLNPEKTLAARSDACRSGRKCGNPPS